MRFKRVGSGVLVDAKVTFAVRSTSYLIVCYKQVHLTLVE